VLQAWLVDGFGAVQNESGTMAFEMSRQSTERVCVPPPQATEQAPQAPTFQE